MPQRSEITFLYLLKRAELAAKKRLEEVLEPFDITAVQYAALTSLERHPGLTAAALARHSFVTAQTTAQLVRGLESLGLIVREPDPNSKRQVLLALSPAGRALLDEIRGPVEAIERRMTASIDSAQLEQLLAVLESIRVSVEP
ncbi:MAG TPA: MarR family transcriptional regulator [Microbacteriaceae bacterium]|nr:MarR family transcriptional regulator [Microbacteriaceae bacterium]